jgi:hypothetical protein
VDKKWIKMIINKMEVSNKKQMLKIFKIGKSKIIRSVGEIMILMNK